MKTALTLTLAALLLAGCATRPMPEGVTVCETCVPEGDVPPGLVAYIEDKQIIVVNPDAYTDAKHRHEECHLEQDDEVMALWLREGLCKLAEHIKPTAADARYNFVELRQANPAQAYNDAADAALRAANTCLSDEENYRRTAFAGGL